MVRLIASHPRSSYTPLSSQCKEKLFNCHLDNLDYFQRTCINILQMYYGSYPLTIFAKKLHSSCSTGFERYLKDFLIDR